MEALQVQPGISPPAGHSPITPELVLAAQHGVAGAFDTIVAALEQRVYRQCLRRGLNPDDAMDVTQEVFLKAYRSLGGYRHQYAFSTWLFRITENACIDFWRKHARHGSLMQPLAGESGEVELEHTSAEPDPEAALEQQRLGREIAAAFAALPSILRDAFLLKEQEGLAYAQIADRLGCTVGTVKSRVFRARQALMARLEPVL